LLKDVTGDGRVDLVAGGGDSGVFIYPGLAVKPGQMAANFFAERLPLPTGRFGTGTVTVDIQSHDINQDGLPDLLISQSSNSYQGRAVQLLLQGPQGQWRDETDQRLHNWDFSSEWITFIHLVDLNQDGHHDLLASGTSARGDVVFINDGTGHFSPAGSSNGFPALSGAWLVPAETGKLLSVAHSSTGLISVRSIALDAGLTGPDSALPAVMGAPGFNEQFYLRHHPSLAADVAAGRIESGLASYLATGRALGERAYAPGTTVWGSTGLDAVHYAGRSSQYTVSLGSTGDWQLTGGSTGAAHDVFKSIERIHFQGTSLSLDLPSSAGQVAKTLGAVFGKESVANKAFVGIGLHFVDELQYSYTSLMQLAINARLGANPTHAQVVDLLYTNVVGQAPDAVTRKTFTDLLDNGTFTVGGLGVLAADTELNQTNIKLVGLAQTGLEYLPFGG
jgi:hypothetical protein